jgi:hypothetical protein
MTDATFTLITSRSEFAEAIRVALREAADQGGRTIVMSDPTFADWPLNEREVVDCLSRWAESHRTLTLVAQNFDEFHRKHPRWVTWRQNWSHIVQCRQADEADIQAIPAQLLIPNRILVRSMDRINLRGRLSRDKPDLIQAQELISDILDRSTETFPCTTLGL